MKANARQKSISRHRSKKISHKDFLNMLLEDCNRYKLHEPALTPVTIILEKFVYRNFFVSNVNLKSGLISVFRDNGDSPPSTGQFYYFEIKGLSYRY